MEIIGALAFAITVFFAVGLATGNAPTIRLRKTRRTGVSKRQIWLTQAGLEMSPTQFHVALAAVFLVVFAVVSAVTSTPIVAVAPAVGSVIIPYAFFSRRRTSNLSRTARSWPDAILELISAVESNASLHGALVQLAYRGPEPLRPVFARFPAMASTLGVVPALEVVRERLSDPTSDRVIEVLILAHERGGGIVTDILRDLARNTAEDIQLEEEIRTAQLEQKINGRAVFILPWTLLIVLVLINPDFRNFYQSPFGFGVVVFGGLMSVVGILVLSAIERATPEARVFGGSAVSTEVIREEALQ